MKSVFYSALLLLLFGSTTSFAQHMEMTAELSGNNILVKIKPVDGPLTLGWSDIEFFFRNPDTSPIPDFVTATITINTTDFPNILMPYQGMNNEGKEIGYNNYKFGTSYPATTTKTYNQDQEYLLCTISSPTNLVGTNLELCHNEPNFFPHYVALTNGMGADVSNLAVGENKFYGTGAIICNPNCPVTTAGKNHILPISGTESAPLPVELLLFEVEKTGQHQARLIWTTAVEKELREFQIERSSNGTTWRKIGTEAAKGSHHPYTYPDNNPPTGIVYYRLSMQDLDGHKTYSPVRSITFDQEKSLSISPNPTSGLVYLVWNADEPAFKRDIQLFDSTGRLLLARTTENNTTSIDISGIAAGAYWLRISSGAQTWSHRIIRL